MQGDAAAAVHTALHWIKMDTTACHVTASGRCHGWWSLCQTVTRFAWQCPSWPTASCSSVSHCVPCHEVCMTRSPFAWWKVNFCYYLTPPPPPPSASRDTEAVIEIIDKTPQLLPNSHAVQCVVNIVQALHLNSAFSTSSSLLSFSTYPPLIITHAGQLIVGQFQWINRGHFTQHTPPTDSFSQRGAQFIVIWYLEWNL